MEEGHIDHCNTVSGCMKETKEKYSKTWCYYYGARAHCLMCIEANTMALAFERRKSFIERLTGKEIGGRTQICLCASGFKENVRS